MGLMCMCVGEGMLQVFTRTREIMLAYCPYGNSRGVAGLVCCSKLKQKLSGMLLKTNQTYSNIHFCDSQKYMLEYICLVFKIPHLFQVLLLSVYIFIKLTCNPSCTGSCWPCRQGKRGLLSILGMHALVTWASEYFFPLSWTIDNVVQAVKAQLPIFQPGAVKLLAANPSFPSTSKSYSPAGTLGCTRQSH